MIHSIVIGEMKAMRNLALQKHCVQNNKWSSFLNSILNIFKKIQNLYNIACYNILTIGIDILQFQSKVNSNLVFSFIVYPFLLNVFSKINSRFFSLTTFLVYILKRTINTTLNWFSHNPHNLLFHQFQSLKIDMEKWPKKLYFYFLTL